ncbi:cytochrome P450 [Herpetosiphon sp. NSE202]|uniref:cytochrome P450 family protein n=1 Tax=Herpetosiphon sp. NSE202 TaxID=3351349 RepID=UPI00364021C2
MTQQQAHIYADDSIAQIFQPSSIENPYPLFAELRAKAAVVAVPSPYEFIKADAWLITRYAEAVQVLKDSRFTVDATILNPGAGVFGQTAADGAEDRSFLGAKSMVSADGAEHSRLRSLVAKAFTPRYIEQLRPRIQELADELLDQVQAQGSMDLVHDYAYPLPINVISEMLGVPADERDQMRLWSDALTSHSPESQVQLREFAMYVQTLIADKRRNPQDDLISKLVELEATGDALSESELLATAGLLIFAGHETTSNLLSIGSLMLLDHPAQRVRLQADPSLIPAAVEELLRFNGPIFSPAPRFALEDLELAGQQIRRGDLVLVALGSANHDESVFENPEELDIARQISRQLAFGHGVHFCLGAPLARLEGEIAFTTLLQRMPNLRLAVPREQIAWRDNINLRGLKALPVNF